MTRRREYSTCFTTTRSGAEQVDVHDANVREFFVITQRLQDDWDSLWKKRCTALLEGWMNLNTEAHRVFVYGTLRRGEINCGLLAHSRCITGKAQIRARMYDTGLGWPSVVLDEAGLTYGEVYEVTDETLQNLDRLEGYEGPEGKNDYDRVTVQVETDWGELSALVYVYSPLQVIGMPEVVSGDWCQA